VQVIDQQQQRRRLGQVGQQPVDTIHHCETIGRRHVLRQHRSGNGSRAGPRRVASASERVGEQMADDSVGEPQLIVGATRPQDLQPGVTTQLLSRQDQLRLADSGRAEEQHRGGLAARSRLDGTAQSRELTLPLKQPLWSEPPVHAPASF
jgi:hypothetical protein